MGHMMVTCPSFGEMKNSFKNKNVKPIEHQPIANKNKLTTFVNMDIVIKYNFSTFSKLEQDVYTKFGNNIMNFG